MNNDFTRLTGKEPNQLLKSAGTSINEFNYSRPVGLDEAKSPPGVKVRYLYARGEGKGGEKRHATDPIWSLEVYDLSRSVVSGEQPVLYYLSEETERNFVGEDLHVIPENTELPKKNYL